MSYASREQTAAETQLCILFSNLSVTLDELVSLRERIDGDQEPRVHEAIAYVESACEQLQIAKYSIVDKCSYGDER